MTDYRIYVVGTDGHFVTSRGFVCDGDEHAIEWAKQSIEDQPIELWSGKRMVTRLSPPPKHGDSNSYEIHDGRMVPKHK
jgi:hypothetical protein